MSDRSRLLRKAVDCYLNDGQIQDACRCLEGLGDYLRAGRLYQQERSWLAAAIVFRKAGAWSEAADCYLLSEVLDGDGMGGLAGKAAQCYLEAGDSLQSAWIYAHRAGQLETAREILREHHNSPGNFSDQLLSDAVLARCECAEGNFSQSGQYVIDITSRLKNVGSVADRKTIEARTLAVAQSMDRPDLCAALFAASYLAGVPGAEIRWEAWALETLGDATGVPQHAYQNDSAGVW